MSRTKPTYYLLCILFLALLSIFLETTIAKANIIAGQPERLKIGLALGGGSAAGFTHIGVLKWLEENRIPIDYIAGTSMGGLIGGCYAMGMSPEEIRSLVLNINWNDLFTGEPPYNSLTFRRKEDHRDYPFMELGYKNKRIELPSGLNIYKIDFILSRITLPYSKIKDFKLLPTPFKCVATDIRNTQSVVLEDGSLKEALRATMAIPGAFPPVERNNELLVDGGILNNVPVEVVRATGVDKVIAVNITPPVSKQESKSIGSILSRTLDAFVAKNADLSKSLADIVLEPSFTDLDHLQWNAVDRYIELGYQTAEAHADSLRKLSLDPISWQKYLKNRLSNAQPDTAIPTEIRIEGASPLNRSDIAAALTGHIGKPINTELLEEDLTALIGSDLYESLSYEYDVKNGQTVLNIIVKEKNYGPPFIRFGMQSAASGISTDNNNFKIGSRITYFNITGPYSELRVDTNIGTDLSLSTELYKPLSNRNYFFAGTLFAGAKEESLFKSDHRITDYVLKQSGVQLDLGYSPNPFSELRFGYTEAYQNVKIKVGEHLSSDYDGEVGFASLKWSYSSADDSPLQLQSLDCNFNIRWYLAAPEATEKFGNADATLRWSTPWGADNTWVTFVSAGSSFKSSPPLTQQFKLGGPYRLSAYSYDQFQGDDFFLVTTGFLKLIRQYSSGIKVYLGCFLENGSAFMSSSDMDLKTDLAVNLITSTFFGPFTIGTSIGKNSEVTAYIVLGHML